MPNAQSRRPANRKKHVPDSRTKFDIWLDNHLETGQTVEFVFSADPEGALGNIVVNRTAKILTVDRYMIYMELQNPLFEDDESEWVPMWVSKAIIVSAE